MSFVEESSIVKIPMCAALILPADDVRMSSSPLLQATDGVGVPTAEHVMVMRVPERTVTTLPALTSTGVRYDKETTLSCEELINGGWGSC